MLIWDSLESNYFSILIPNQHVWHPIWTNLNTESAYLTFNMKIFLCPKYEQFCLHLANIIQNSPRIELVLSEEFSKLTSATWFALSICINIIYKFCFVESIVPAYDNNICLFAFLCLFVCLNICLFVCISPFEHLFVWLYFSVRIQRGTVLSRGGTDWKSTRYV